MHELSLAQSIVEIVEGAARDNDARSVASVTLSVGELAGVEMQSLMQGLKIASQGTVMQDAAINVVRPAGTAWCMQCGRTVPLKKRGDACPECGGFQLAVNGGEDFRVSELELGD